jgi:hypothetical protein
VAESADEFAIIFDPENGFQLFNVAKDEVADVAVLEGTWRKRGEPAPSDDQVQGHLGNIGVAGSPAGIQGLTTIQYGGLRIRSTGLMPYAISASSISPGLDPQARG